MLISLLHRTTFAYVGKARDSFIEVRLKPVDDAGQICRSFDLRIEPAAQVREYIDFYSNTVHYFDIVAGHDRLMIEAVSEVETTPNSARPAVPSSPMPVPGPSASSFRSSLWTPISCRLKSRCGRRPRMR